MQVKQILLWTAALSASLVAAAPPQARSICSDGCSKAAQLTECTPAWTAAMKDCMVCTKFLVDPLAKCSTTGSATIATVPNPTSPLAGPTGTSTTTLCDKTCNLQAIDRNMTKCSSEWKSAMETCLKNDCIAFIVDPIKECEAGTSSIKTFWPRATVSPSITKTMQTTASPSTTGTAPASLGTGSACSACVEMHHLPICSSEYFDAVDRCSVSPCSEAIKFLPRIPCPHSAISTIGTGTAVFPTPSITRTRDPRGIAIVGTGTAVFSAPIGTGTGIPSGCHACYRVRQLSVCSPEYELELRECRASPCRALAPKFAPAIVCPGP